MSDLNLTKIGIPLHGKMAARALHLPSFREHLRAGGLAPVYFLSPHYYHSFDFDPQAYFELQTEAYDRQLAGSALLQNLKLLRRFVVRTATTDLRLRETIENMVFDTSLPKIGRFVLLADLLRRIPRLGSLLAWSEARLFPTHAHTAVLKEQEIRGVLTPGMGNYNFWNEGNFALEAQRLGLPAFAVITNYDNIVNMGFRSFMPACLAVWSKQMADEAMQLHGFPARRIEITGPVQYDRFMQPLPMGREDFFRSIHLDPARRTIFYAGGVTISRYFEVYRLFVEQRERLGLEPFNLVVRPQPHLKLLGSPGWQVIEKLFLDAGAHVSNPGSIDASGDRKDEFRLDLAFQDGPDELIYLLRYSDVMINYFSTISLEAAICDLPAIQVGYDAYTFGHHFNTTAAFQQRMTHNRRKLRLAAAKVAKSESELITFVQQYLGDRSLDREARRLYAVSECGQLDGMAGARLTAMIMDRMK